MSVSSIKKALLSDAISKDGIDISHAVRRVRMGDEISKYVAPLQDKSNIGAFTFVRLTPKHFSKRKLFGSYVPTSTAMVLEVCPAVINSDGAYVPQEDKPYFKALITEKTLSDLVFNRNCGKNEPVTFLEIGGVPVSPPEEIIPANKVYGGSLRKAIDSVLKSMELAESESIKLQNVELKLNKSNKAQLLEALEAIQRYANRGMSFDLDMDSEKFRNDMVHIKAETIATLTSHITKMSEELALPDLTKNEVTVFETFFELYTDYSNREGEAELLRRLARTLPGDHKHSQKVKDLNRAASCYSNEHIVATHRNRGLSKACLGMSQVHGNPPFFFGDTVMNCSWYNLTISFAAERQRSSGEIRIESLVDVMHLNLTQSQMMELIQCSLLGTWVKSTMDRFLGKGIPLPDVGSQHDEFQIDVPNSPDESKTLSALMNQAMELVESKSQSLATRNGLKEIVDRIACALDKEIEARLETHNKAQAEMSDKFIAHTQSQITTLLEEVGERHPQLAEQVKALLIVK